MPKGSIKISSLLEYEKTHLYNYMLRMLGESPRAFNALDEVYDAVRESSSTDLKNLRLMLYTTAKSFNSDSWGRHATINDSLQGNKLEEILFDLPCIQQEVFFLHHIARFEFNAVSEILSIPSDQVQQYHDETTMELKSKMPEAEGKFLALLAIQNLPDSIEATTQALSEIMADVRKSRAKPLPYMATLYFMLFVIFAVIICFHFLEIQ